LEGAVTGAVAAAWLWLCPQFSPANWSSGFTKKRREKKRKDGLGEKNMHQAARSIHNNGLYHTLLLRGRQVVVRIDESVLLSSRQWRSPALITEREPVAFFGNKGWKLSHWIHRRADEDPLLLHPHACLVSHGGCQSNAMLALAQLAHMKRVRFVYYTKAKQEKTHFPTCGGGGETSSFHSTTSSSSSSPSSPPSPPSSSSPPIVVTNLQRALALGMELRKLPSAEYSLLFGEEPLETSVDGDGAHLPVTALLFIALVVVVVVVVPS